MQRSLRNGTVELSDLVLTRDLRARPHNGDEQSPRGPTCFTC